MSENITKNQFDSINENIIKSQFDLVTELPNSPNSLRYGIDYDYIVESFCSEFKLDVDELKNIQARYRVSDNPIEQQALINQFHQLYPEYTANTILSANIPDTVIKKVYFVQSPKGKNGLPSIHYSLKEKLLSDLRALRSIVKKMMAEACERGDHVSEVRFNAMQLAIKVVMNSEYGVSGNKVLANFDPEVAGAMTYASRCHIAFLTSSIESSELYVDKKFLEDNAKQIETLRVINCLSYEPFYDYPTLFDKRRKTLRRIFDDTYNVISNEVFKITIKPSTVCYQDTDSNYYRNDYIANYYTKIDTDSPVCSPEIIDECMHAMLAHNELIASYASSAIQRRPYGLGFEGAFIVCRYLNRKKKYYGIKWGDDSELRLGYRLAPEAYDENGNLIDDYTPFWKPKKTVIPQPNGQYIYLDVDKLLNGNINQLDYIKSQNVKCTGVDLARRDQYRFINFFHMVVLQTDLRLMKYLGGGKWELFDINESMKEVIDNIITQFGSIVGSYTDIANLASDKKPEYYFNILDFSKNQAYKKDKRGAIPTIVQRLKAQQKDKYIPSYGERVNYIVLLDEKTKQERLMGKVAVGGVAERSYLVQEILDELHEKYPKEEIEEQIKSKSLNLTYDDYINAKVVCMLDFKYYLGCLSKSMALYIVGDVYPNEIKEIDDGLLDSVESRKRIDKLTSKISKEYVDKYFYTTRKINTNFNKAKKDLNVAITNINKEGIELIYSAYKQFQGKELTKKNRLFIQMDCENEIRKRKELSRKMEEVYKFILTNGFNKFSSKNQTKTNLYEKYKDNPNELFKQKNICDNYIAVYERILKLANDMKTNDEKKIVREDKDDSDYEDSTEWADPDY